MGKTFRYFSATAASLVVICGVASLVLAQTRKAEPAKAPAKPMSVEEALKVAAASKKNLATPPRTIDDITKVLAENKPDPAKLKQLIAAADKKPPANLSGFKLAEFLNERGLAARDLGRTQQMLADLREAYKLAKATAMKPPAWPAFTKRPGSGGGGGGGAGKGKDLANRVTTGRRDEMRPVGGGGGGRGGGGGGGQMSNAEKRQISASRMSPELQKAQRIVQNYIQAELDSGNFRTAVAVYEEMRPYIANGMAGMALGMDVTVATIEARNGNIPAAQRNIGRAQQLFARSREWPHSSEYWNGYTAAIETGQGTVAFTTGKFAEAEAKFRSALRYRGLALVDSRSWLVEKPAPGRMEAGIAGNRLRLAHALLRQGKVIEAEVETRRALVDLLRLQSESSPRTAAAVLALADLMQLQGRYRDAQRLAEAALDIYQRGGVEKATHGDAFERIAVAQASQGKWPEALATYDKLKAALAHDEAARKQYVDANLYLGVALVRSGQANQAIPIFEEALRRRMADGGDNEYRVAEARGFLGTAQAAAGRDEQALATLRAALPHLLAASDATAMEEGAIDETRRRRTIVEGYFDLLARIRGTEIEKKAGIDALDETFRLSDVAHAKSVHSAIAASSARAASGEGPLANLIRQTQDTDQQILAMTDMIKATLEAPRDQQDAKILETLRKDMAQLKQARQTLRREIERQFPQYAQLINPKPVGIAEARAKLGEHEVLVVTYFSGGQGHVWAVRKNHDPVAAPIGLPESEMVQLVDHILKGASTDVSLISAIPPFDVAAANKLYKAVLGPVASALADAKSIIVVPHGALGRLPFALLVTEAPAQPLTHSAQPLFAEYRNVPFLIRRATVTHIPSVAAFASLRSVPAGAANRKPFLGFGDPWFSLEQAEEAKREQARPIEVAMRGKGITMRAAANTAALASAELAQIPRLPDTAQEVLEVAAALGADQKTDVVLGADASEQRVRSMKLDDRRVVMFATHGLVPGDLDGLTQPALALSSPEIPGVQGDGLLTAEDILGLKLDADWVVLSACNTAAGEGTGAEAVSGLGRAFFYAGARALLVTHWPVETVSARLLTTDLFRRQGAQQNLSRAEAVRQTMVEMIDKTEAADQTPKYTYAHPTFWAPFALIGDGENRAR